MKSLILFVCSLFVSVTAMAECASGGYEAQGFFVVESAKLNAEQQCVVSLKVDWSKGDYAFRENPNCPLDPSEIQNADLIGPMSFNGSSGTDVVCDWKSGQKISGILVLRNGRISLE
jgi:hypothetical protein